MEECFWLDLLEDRAKGGIVYQVGNVISDIIDRSGQVSDIDRMQCGLFA